MLVIFIPMLVSILLPVWQQFIRYQMMEELEAKNLTTVTIKNDDLRWTRRGKEITVNGNLFDVNEISKQGGFYIVTGLYDKDEDVLLEMIKKSQQTTNDKPLQLFASQVMHSVLFLENKMDSLRVIFKLLSNHYYILNTDRFISFSLALAAPPPKCS